MIIFFVKPKILTNIVSAQLTNSSKIFYFDLQIRTEIYIRSNPTRVL